MDTDTETHLEQHELTTRNTRNHRLTDVRRNKKQHRGNEHGLVPIETPKMRSSQKNIFQYVDVIQYGKSPENLGKKSL